jgi:hypothetical protein
MSAVWRRRATTTCYTPRTRHPTTAARGQATLIAETAPGGLASKDARPRAVLAAGSGSEGLVYPLRWIGSVPTNSSVPLKNAAPAVGHADSVYSGRATVHLAPPHEPLQVRHPGDSVMKRGAGGSFGRTSERREGREATRRKAATIAGLSVQAVSAGARGTTASSRNRACLSRRWISRATPVTLIMTRGRPLWAAADELSGASLRWR